MRSCFRWRDASISTQFTDDMRVPRYVSVEQSARIHHVDTSVSIFVFVLFFGFVTSKRRLQCVEMRSAEKWNAALRLDFRWQPCGELKLFSLFLMFYNYASISPSMHMHMCEGKREKVSGTAQHWFQHTSCTRATENAWDKVQKKPENRALIIFHNVFNMNRHHHYQYMLVELSRSHKRTHIQNSHMKNRIHFFFLSRLFLSRLPKWCEWRRTHRETTFWSTQGRKMTEVFRIEKKNKLIQKL